MLARGKTSNIMLKVDHKSESLASNFQSIAMHNMLLRLIAISLFGFLPQFAIAQSDSPQTWSSLELNLPANVPLYSVQYSYFMTGPFGGAGEFGLTFSGSSSIRIPTSQKDSQANNFKLVAYIPGCQLVSIDIEILNSLQAQNLPCEPLQWVTLRGQIEKELIRDGADAVIRFDYEADWADRFFGVADGPAPEFIIARVAPDKDGNFEIRLPDFSKLDDGMFHASLFDLQSTEQLATLTSVPGGDAFGGFKPSASYPSLIVFHKLEPKAAPKSVQQ
jgi:hypothetical protein